MARAKAAKVYTGGCLCGEIRFEATGPLAKPHTCSCRMCQHVTGALTAIWVELPSDRIRWVGPGGRPATYRSSEFSSRTFCVKCGSSLGAIDDKPVVALLAGAFDRPSSKDLRPTTHSFTAARPRWWHIEIKAE